jgi:ATP-dependent Clp protease ATP-binding subunit ClpC
MMAEGDGVGAAVLMQLEVDFSVARQAIESKVPNGNRPSASGDLPYDAHARMFELSRVESRNMNHSYIGTEHLLLGIIGEAQAIATLELSNAGVTLEAARREVRMLLGEGFNDAPIGAA